MRALVSVAANLGLCTAIIAASELVLSCDRFWPFRLPRQLVPVAWPLFAAGSVLITAAVATFVAVGHGSGTIGNAPRRLVTAGPYRYLRNPIYVGGSLLLFGVAFYRQSPSFLVVAAGLLGGIDTFVRRVEEPRLAARFGEEYLAYMRAVPRWIPRLRGRRRAPEGKKSPPS